MLHPAGEWVNDHHQARIPTECLDGLDDRASRPQAGARRCVPRLAPTCSCVAQGSVRLVGTGRWDPVFAREVRMIATGRRSVRSLRRGAQRVRGLVTRQAAQLRTAAKDAGMATAEYAIVTLAAVGFAGLLLAILRSDEVRGALLGIIRRALSSS
jgi:hypothetical protein